jgi:hypothetical protein
VIPLSIRRSLRAKVALGFLVPLALLLGIFSAIQYLRHQEAHEAALTLLAGQTSQAIESSLHNEMLNRNLEGLQKTVDAIGQGDAIRALSVLDLAGQVMIPLTRTASTDPRQPDQRVSPVTACPPPSARAASSSNCRPASESSAA